MIILTVQMLLPPPGVNNHQPVLQPPSSYTCYSARVRTDIRVNIFIQPWNSSLTLYAWDPGPKTRNKRAHITNGDRGQRGKGLTCLYWNKGPPFLTNKMLDIETIVQAHKPHILGLGEANLHHDHDVEDVQLPGYTLHVDSSIDNPNLGIAIVVVYTHNILRVRRREDLEDDTITAIWLEFGLPHQKSCLVCIGYRQWCLLGQP